MAAEKLQSLSGVWSGLYTYITLSWIPESHFVAVWIDSGGVFSGTIHETMNLPRGGAVDVNANVQGKHEGGMVRFIKTYDGTGGQSHSVAYDGILSEDRSEIEGTWRIRSWPAVQRGRFLMVRNRPLDEVAKIEVFEKA